MDLREWDSPVDDQFQLGSCVGNAIANAYELQVRVQYPDEFVELSRLFIYYNSRTIVGETNEDTGTTVRAGVKAVRLYGICSETVWPYNVEKFDDRPSLASYKDAKFRNIKAYQRLYSDADTMDAITQKKPVVIAADVFDEFMYLDSNNSTVPMPTDHFSGSGHAMCIVGYDKDRAAYLVKNSFGTEWGDMGYCWMPFDYANQYVFERWVFDITDQTPRTT